MMVELAINGIKNEKQRHSRNGSERTSPGTTEWSCACGNIPSSAQSRRCQDPKGIRSEAL